MMDNLRAASNNVVLKIILALIILSFILTGMGNYLTGGSGDYAAKVDGEVIERTKLEQAFQNERLQRQQQLGEQFSIQAGNESYIQQMRAQVLSQLIDEVLLGQYTKKLGLSVSDEQVKEAIRNEPGFHTDGKFDNAKYRNVLTLRGYNADNYARLLRNQMNKQQLLQGLSDSTFVLPSDSQTISSLMLQERDIRVATIDLKMLRDKQIVSEDELKAYYEQNQNSFISPEQVKVSYIALSAAAMENNATVTDAEISAYYEQNQNSYGEPESRSYSLIQLNTEADANAILQQLKAGADFATLAKEKSTDIVSGRQGGELEWRAHGSVDDEIEQAKLTEKGQLSGVLKSSVGYLIVRLNDIKPAVMKPLNEVRDSIVKQLQQDKVLDAYYALQQKVSEAATNDNESLASAEEAAGIKAVQTEWFSPGNIPAALNFKAVVQSIFDGSLLGENGSPSSNSDVITVDGKHAFVIRIADHQPERIESLDKVKDRVAEIVKYNKAVKAAKLQGEKLLVELKQGKGDEAMKAAGLTFSSAQKLSRSSENRQLSETVFSMQHPQETKPTYSLSQDQQGNVVVVALDTVKPGVLPEADTGAFADRMNANLQAITFDLLLGNLRKEASITMGAVEQQPQ